VSREFLVTPEAERDALEAYWWYEGQRAGLGTRFLQVVESTFRKIQTNPFAASIRKRRARRKPVAGFPYGVFYVVGDDYISVVSIHHDKRDPKSWESRV
jgi:plasmid stabilization system protein ParE